MHTDGPSRRSQRRSCPEAAMRPASLSGTGLWPAERGPCRRLWRRSGENRRDARVRGRRGVSPVLSPCFFHSRPSIPPPVVRHPCRAALGGAAEPEVKGGWMQAPDPAQPSTLLAASAAARRCSAGSATCSGQSDPTGPRNRRFRFAMRPPIRNGLERGDVERGDILFHLPPPIASRALGFGAQGHRLRRVDRWRHSSCASVASTRVRVRRGTR